MLKNNFMFCSYCGSKLLEEAKFCHICGRVLEKQEGDHVIEIQENNNFSKDKNKKDSEETSDKILAVFFVLLCFGAIIYLAFY